MAKIRYKIVADFLLLLHILWIALLGGGTIFIIYYPWYTPWHLSLLTATLLLNLFLGGCPLTWLEEKCRKAWNPNTLYYSDSFFATYSKKILGINLTPKQANIILALAKVTSYITSLLILTKSI
jgi:hypothetical protein